MKGIMDSSRPGIMSQWCELTFIMSWLLYIVKVTLSSHSGGIGVVGNPVGSCCSVMEEPLSPAPL